MKFLEILEKGWLAASVAAFVMGTYYLVTLRNFSYHVYFSYFCFLFCILLWRNIRGQRIFIEKMKQEEKEKGGRPADEMKNAE